MRLTKQLGLDDATIAWDTHHDGHVLNWWRAVEIACRDNPTHALILEDDAEPCLDFLPAVRKLIERYPDLVMSFFSVKDSAQQQNRLTLTEHYGLSDVAVVYPRGVLEDLRLEFKARGDELTKTQWQAGGGADEMRIKLQPMQKSWSTMPSLVQHGCPNESTLGHHFAHRLSPSFIGTHTSALLLDWSQL